MSGRIEDFEKRGCLVIGVSTDSIETHVKWLTASPEDNGLGALRFPLASDVGGEVCEKYGVYDQRKDMALRGLFLIDPNGVLQYQVTHNLNVGRSTDEVIRVLDAVQSGGLCPAEKTANEALDLHEVIRPKQVLGNFEIESEIGNGAFGKVFLALDTMLQRKVAVKVLKSGDKDQLESLVSEARNAATLNHPNVCTVHSIDQSKGNGMIVMEYVEGETLVDRMKNGTIDTQLVTQVTYQIADAMTSAHQAGIVHGDLKPANIMLTRDDNVKVMDFGLSKQTASRSFDAETIDRDWRSVETSRTGQSSFALSMGISGTPKYMSPELTRGKPASKMTDVFALGLIVYELVTGKSAIHGENLLDVIRCIDSLDGETLAKEVPSPLDRVVRESLIGAEVRRRITMEEIANHVRLSV